MVPQADVLVVGSGVAGLSAALAAAGAPEGGAQCRVILVTPGKIGDDGASTMAQGGIAAAMDPADHPDAHARDTFLAGERLGDPARIRQLTYDAPERIHDLLRWGARFDRGSGGQLAMGLEGAHGFRRILHAQGDQTGRELVRVLRLAVQRHPRIQVMEETTVLSLLTGSGLGRQPIRVTGALLDRGGADRFALEATVTILATGGAGRLYHWTTNPTWAWGDGVALGMQVGAWLAGMEFVQFHPTALRVDGDPLPLVTEALRGEGARLVDGAGHPIFMGDPDTRAGDLAPRHLVTRALWRHQQNGGEVFLDARTAIGSAFPKRFPWIFQVCQNSGVDPQHDLIPVTPAAHYLMGGIAADADGRTSVKGLRVAGEVAWTGVHGANRLASNSLLEGLVFGTRAGRSVAHASSADEAMAAAPSQALGPLARPFLMEEGSVAPPMARGDLSERGRQGGSSPGSPSARSMEDVERDLRRLMWDQVGVERSGSGLREARRALERLASEAARRLMSEEGAHRLLIGRIKVAQAMTQAALLRSESLGSHQRVDRPAISRGQNQVGIGWGLGR